MTPYQCAACRTQVQTWNGDPARCAFEQGTFSPENWNCATVARLRRYVYEGQTEMPARVDYRYASDEKFATVNIHDLPGLPELPDGEPGAPLALALWVAWYKDRGGTDAIWLLDSSGQPRVPSERELLHILDHLEA